MTGVLLVGGASTRFGSPKALAKFAGETLAERAWRTLGRICDERIAVGKCADRLALPFDIRDDVASVRAPLAGVVAGLRAARNDLAVVLPVDLPLIRASDLERLADACADAAVPPTGPLPCALARTALPVLEARLDCGQLALRDAFAALRCNVVAIDDDALVNVNTAADLEALDVSIVPYRAEHAAGFRSLVADTLREFGFAPDPQLDPDLADPGAVYEGLWVALSGGDVVGSVALRRIDRTEVELKRMYLRSTLRGRGIGRKLLQMAILWGREHGITRITLDTTERMVAALHLYEVSGFVRTDGAAPRQGQSRLLYELRL